jgi:uncharacterized protein (TIGR02118 family)
MIKMIALLSRKPGLSLDAFREYYETRHVPLIRSIAATVLDYRRSYVEPGTILTGGISGEPGDPWLPEFDVITEVWFADQAAYDAARSAFARKDNAERIAADEERFLDRTRKRIFLVREYSGGH